MSQVFVQLKYVLFSWRLSNILKRDPLAKSVFTEQITLPGLFTILGTPLTLHEASIGSKPRELFLADDQCVILRAKLAESMGPTRTAQSWRAEANHLETTLKGLKSYSFQDVTQLEAHMAKLQAAEDLSATDGAYRELLNTRKVWRSAKQRGLGSVIALDVETWERDHNDLTEFGWSTLTFSNGEEQREDVHAIIEENTDKRNGRWCADARDHYDFGESEYVQQEQLRVRLDDLFTTLSRSAPLFLVMHDPRSDLEALELLGINIRSWHRDLHAFKAGDGDLPAGIWVLDTQALYCGWKREKRKSKLEVCCEAIKVPTRRLHNAGNDAHYTLAVLEGLMETEADGSPAQP